MRPHLFFGMCGQEESEPSALSSGEEPHFSLSAQPQGNQPIRCACAGPIRQLSSCGPHPRPQGSHFSTQLPKFKTKFVHSFLPLILLPIHFPVFVELGLPPRPTEPWTWPV